MKLRNHKIIIIAVSMLLVVVYARMIPIYTENIAKTCNDNNLVERRSLLRGDTKGSIQAEVKHIESLDNTSLCSQYNEVTFKLYIW